MFNHNPIKKGGYKTPRICNSVRIWRRVCVFYTYIHTQTHTHTEIASFFGTFSFLTNKCIIYFRNFCSLHPTYVSAVTRPSSGAPC
jgi:hypothetical protein